MVIAKNESVRYWVVRKIEYCGGETEYVEWSGFDLDEAKEKAKTVAGLFGECELRKVTETRTEEVLGTMKKGTKK